MTETIADRLRHLLEKSGLSASEASRRAGGSAGTIKNILNGSSKNPRIDTVRRLAMVFEVSPDWLAHGAGQPEITGEVRPAPSVLPQIGALPRDVPVMGTVAAAEMGRGAFIFGEVVDYATRLPGIMGAPDVYALYVTGDSMSPKFEPGDLIYVHPHRQPRAGDIVIIQELDSDNGIPRGFIKQLVAETGDAWKTRQFNPPTNISFLRRRRPVVHRVLTTNELAGV